jgi:TPR repeat protein
MRLPLLVFLALIATPLWAATAPPAKAGLARTGANAFSRNPALPKWVAPLEAVPPTTSDEPVVVRLAEAQYWTGPNPAYLVNRAVQVNASSRLSEIGQVSISFVPAYQKLVLHRVAIVRGGQVMDRGASANVRVLDSESDAGQGYYYGASTAQLLLDDVKVGDTLWLTYSVEGGNPVFGAMWSEHLPWTKEAPVELRKVSVMQPSAKPVQWRVSGLARASLPAPSVEHRNGVTTLVFRETALAAEELEPSTPPQLIPLPLLDFTDYTAWNQVALWSNALFSATPASAEVQALARTFASGTPEQRASQALHWVQDEIRYFSVSMGENSHRPQLPAVVLQRRFGDCKDKSQLLVALCRAMGLDAQAVLVNASVPTLPAQFLPSPASFNHVIVRVQLDGTAYFVDPTRQNERGPISALVVPVAGAAGLVVAPDSTGLITLPEESMAAPLVERSEQLTVPTLNGDGQLRLRTEYRGRFATGMRAFYRSMSSSEVRKTVLEQLERTYPDIKLDDAPKLSDEGASFVVEARLTIPHVLKEEKGSFRLAQRPLIVEGAVGLPSKLVRKQPFWLAAGHYRARYTMDVALPSEARLTKSDELIAVSNGYFEAHGQLTWRGAQLNYYLDFAITNPEVPAKDVPSLVDQVNKLDPLFESKLRFKPVAVYPQAAKEASLRVLDIMEKLSSHSDLQGEALRTGKLPELKFEESQYAQLDYRALCEAVIDGYAVRDWNPLLAAPMASLYNVVKTRADKRTRDLCATRLYFTGHDVAAASKALATLAPDDDDALTLMQAWADFHAREPARARANLARFLKARHAAATLNADDALLAFALARRLGLAEPDEIGALAASLRPGAWPAPLFALLRGTLSEQDLLAAVARMAPAAREYASMEAHFFAAQVDLATNAPRKADAHLNWFARYGMLGSAFELLADADKYAEARADPDMRAAWKLERERGSANAIIRHQKAAADRGIAAAQQALGNRYLEGADVRTDVAAGQALLEAAAAQGDSSAMNNLGVLFMDGAAGVRDEPRALELYRQAAANGNQFAAYNLGRAYMFGQNGVALDLDKAFPYMRDAAELANKDAQFFLSRLYVDGKGVDKNDQMAIFWASQAHLRNNLSGTAQFGLLLLYLSPDKQMREAGLELLMSAARRNNDFAQCEFARVLLDGVGIAPDPVRAFAMAELSHLHGSERGTALLGRMYAEGLGVTADVPKGLALLATMEKKNLPDAFYQLGHVYRSELAGVTDKAKAAAYFRRGADLGQRDAAESLAIMLHTGDGIARDLPEAARYYEMAARAGYPRSLNNLADMVEKGQGMPQDLAKAMGLYRRSAQLGHPSAMLNLAELYETTPALATTIFVPLAYYMLAGKLGQREGDEGAHRLKTGADTATIEKAQTYVTAWRPGKALPEDS